MLSHRRRTTLFFSALMVIQVLSPLAFVSGQESNPSPETDADLEGLEEVLKSKGGAELSTAKLDRAD